MASIAGLCCRIHSPPARWLRARIAPCDDVRMLRTDPNGLPALAVYRNGGGGVWAPVGVHVPTERDGKIASLYAFLDPAIFPLFDLPLTVSGPAR